MKKAVSIFGVLALTLVMSQSAFALDIGPDAFGYVASDSPTYSWIDMSTGPLPLDMGDDEIEGPFDLGFVFNYYGSTYDEVYISSNGFLLFEPFVGDYEYFQGSQCPLPSPGVVDGMIGFFHRDFDPSRTDGGANTIRYATGGTANDRWFGVSFTSVPVCCTPDPADSVTVQVALYEGSNEILVQVDDPGDLAGGDCTIGIEAPDAIAGLSWPGCLVEDSLTEDMAIMFTPPTGGTPIVPPEQVGWDQPDTSVDYLFFAFNLEATSTVFDIAVTDFEWATALDTTKITLDAGGMDEFTVTVGIPDTASGGDVDVATITLTEEGGGDTIDVYTTTLVQDDPDSWQEASEMFFFVEQPVAVGHGTDLFVAGGGFYDAIAASLFVTDYLQVMHLGGDFLTWDFSYVCPEGAIWDADDECCYDEVATSCVDEEFGTLMPMPDARAYPKGCIMDGKIFVAGGLGVDDLGSFFADTLFIYDIATNDWSEAAAMPAERIDHAVVCDGATDTLFVIGGYGSDEISSPEIWAFDYSSGAWDTSLADMPGTRSGASAQLISADEILVAGGWYDDLASVRSDIYDIGDDTWTRTGDLPAERLRGGSAIFDDRMCLLAGISFAGDAHYDDDTYDCYSEGYWIPQAAVLNQGRTDLIGATIGDAMYVVSGTEENEAEYTPAEYIERYPTGTLPPDPPVDPDPDVAPDVAPDEAPDEAPDMGVPDVTPDAVDEPTVDATPDAVDDAGTGGGGDDDGCGCAASDVSQKSPAALLVGLLLGLGLIRRRRS